MTALRSSANTAQALHTSGCVFERDCACVCRQHEPNHGFLAIPSCNDLTGEVPEEEREDAQRRGLANPVIAQTAAPPRGSLAVTRPLGTCMFVPALICTMRHSWYLVARPCISIP